MEDSLVRKEDHQSNVVDIREITCTNIVLIEMTKWDLHKIQEAITVEHMARINPKIYVAPEN